MIQVVVFIPDNYNETRLPIIRDESIAACWNSLQVPVMIENKDKIAVTGEANEVWNVIEKINVVSRRLEPLHSYQLSEVATLLH